MRSRIVASRPADSALGERLRRQDGIIAQQARGQTVLLRLEDGAYYAIDEVGATIWDRCDGEHTVSELVAELCSEFDAPEKVIRADVLEFVSELRRENLIVVDTAE
jgi:coenzyme PQQ biosynthesis protein PqqD